MAAGTGSGVSRSRCDVTDEAGVVTHEGDGPDGEQESEAKPQAVCKQAKWMESESPPVGLGGTSRDEAKQPRETIS